MTSLSIVIVNWNTGRLLEECLGSIGGCDIPPGVKLESIVVVDNASSDGSVDGLVAGRLPLRVIRNMENRGFGVACNQGADVAPADLLLFLNPDTRLFKDSISTPVDYLRAPENARVGIASIQLVDESGTVSRCCARFPRVSQYAAQSLGIDRILPATGHMMREWDHASTRQVDQVIGAFFLVRGTVFAALQGFDERFFVYFEEVDFALRAKRAGWSSVFLADARAYHVGGGSSSKVRARRLFYSLRSRLQYGSKHYGRLQRWSLALVTWLLEPLSRAVFLSARGRLGELRDLFEAYRMLASGGTGRSGTGAKRSSH